jgi:hypothetical protein
LSDSTLLEERALTRRRRWLAEIVKISGQFGQDSSRLEAELTSELSADGPTALIDHLRLCGAIPEAYGHDSSEEKLYSKYTDALLSVSFNALGLSSAVLTERADAADVEVVAAGYSFVADAKAFRLSRTAKNQKDFKIDAMHGWKRGKRYAMVVCPLYQLPGRSSQIYLQAIARDVCIFSYSHLALLLAESVQYGATAAQSSLTRVLTSVVVMEPSKDAVAYWTALNRAALGDDGRLRALWDIEKAALLDSISSAKNEALEHLVNQRTRLMAMSREEAVAQLLRVEKIDSRVETIGSVSDNGILGIV